MDINNFKLIDEIPYYQGKKLSININSQGYYRVTINKKSYRLHRLIAEKYIPNFKSKPIVDHINGIKADNRVINLQWLTYSENSIKAYHNNKSMSRFNKKNSRRAIISISKTTGLKKEHNSLRNCAKYLNRDVAGVYRCLNGEWNLCNNHKLIYKNASN